MKRQMEQKKPDTDPCIYGYVLYDKDGTAVW